MPDAPAKTIQIYLPDGGARSVRNAKVTSRNACCYTPPPAHAVPIQGHRLRIATIDLAQNWTGIRQDLLQLIDPDPS